MSPLLRVEREDEMMHATAAPRNSHQVRTAGDETTKYVPCTTTCCGLGTSRTMAIPVVDFQALSEKGVTPDLPVVEELHSAFSTVGFVFITNHGIDRKLVSRGPLPVYRSCS